MDEGTAGAVALISIHPNFANAILDGSKQVEFRKVGFRRPVTHALLYATSPIQHIVGFVEVASIEERSPKELWRRFHLLGGIDRAAFFEYYQDRTVGFALRICRPQRLSKPLKLRDIDGAHVPPQSFRYGTASDLERVRRLA